MRTGEGTHRSRQPEAGHHVTGKGAAMGSLAPGQHAWSEAHRAYPTTLPVRTYVWELPVRVSHWFTQPICAGALVYWLLHAQSIHCGQERHYFPDGEDAVHPFGGRLGVYECISVADVLVLYGE